MIKESSSHSGIKLFIALAVAVGTLWAFTPADAASPINHAPGVTLYGYDAVAYFTESKPAKGSKQFAYDWMGAQWHFSSAENRDLFAKNPASYAPQYGGYCAYAVSQVVVADIDPEAWNIVKGKLYLNFSPSVARLWSKDIAGHIAKADKNWPKLRDP